MGPTDEQRSTVGSILLLDFRWADHGSVDSEAPKLLRREAKIDEMWRAAEEDIVAIQAFHGGKLREKLAFPSDQIWFALSVSLASYR